MDGIDARKDIKAEGAYVATCLYADPWLRYVPIRWKVKDT